MKQLLDHPIQCPDDLNYFSSFDELHSMLKDDLLPNTPPLDFLSQYDWQSIVSQYEDLLLKR